jgi:hypothetical protein
VCQCVSVCVQRLAATAAMVSERDPLMLVKRPTNACKETY